MTSNLVLQQLNLCFVFALRCNG